MSYLRAEDVLPKEVIETIQQYVSGKSIYIPSREKQDWGSKTDTKQLLHSRNLEIYQKYQSGVSIRDLEAQYYLSDKSLQRIIRNMRASDRTV